MLLAELQNDIATFKGSLTAHKVKHILPYNLATHHKEVTQEIGKDTSKSLYTKVYSRFIPNS